mmetsp:Transcript_20463/g.61389  ORF Transcript_20463/g.61389 Transcript_20463/m.61389 type:complete len:187 (+) Transcript_20463:1003-1563(+)
MSEAAERSSADDENTDLSAPPPVLRLDIGGGTVELRVHTVGVQSPPFEIIPDGSSFRMNGTQYVRAQEGSVQHLAAREVGKLQSALLEAVEVEGEVEIDARIAPPRSRSERVPAYTAAPERRVGPASRPQRRLPAGRIGRPRADRSLVQGGRATSQRCAPSPRRGESGSGRNHRPTVQTLLIHAGG